MIWLSFPCDVLEYQSLDSLDGGSCVVVALGLDHIHMISI